MKKTRAMLHVLLVLLALLGHCQCQDQETRQRIIERLVREDIIEGEDNEVLRNAITEMVAMYYYKTIGKPYFIGSLTGLFDNDGSFQRKKRFAEFGSSYDGWGSSSNNNNYNNDPWSWNSGTSGYNPWQRSGSNSYFNRFPSNNNNQGSGYTSGSGSSSSTSGGYNRPNNNNRGSGYFFGRGYNSNNPGSGHSNSFGRGYNNPGRGYNNNQGSGYGRNQGSGHSNNNQGTGYGHNNNQGSGHSHNNNNQGSGYGHTNNNQGRGYGHNNNQGSGYGQNNKNQGSGHHSGHSRNYGTHRMTSMYNPHTGKHQTFRCPNQDNSSAIYALNPNTTAYPIQQISDELLRSAMMPNGLFFFLLNLAFNVGDAPNVLPDPAFETANSTCNQTSMMVVSYTNQDSSIGGTCYPIVGFQFVKSVNFTVCQSTRCNCKVKKPSPPRTYSYSKSDSKNITVEECLHTYTPIQVISYCEQPAIGSRIVFDKIIVPTSCGCSSIHCVLDDIRHHKRR